ncbi:hypothetical protein K1719_042746 [Acacia pycnantha]|nr:hypothetical protein K1719_042746 [Acacia pycnantha]
MLVLSQHLCLPVLELEIQNSASFSLLKRICEHYVFGTKKIDIVPRLPFLHYAEVGEELEIDIMKSNFIKHPAAGRVNFRMWHNLELYLHGVAGTQGRKGGFKLEVKRDIALVNKSLDALKSEYHIPKSWRIDENKGLVQQPDGTWRMQDPDSEDDDFLINQ